ncbi:hypothetical protein BIV57_20785 [Mangrovactinospora gilvigrisea]|uniref:Integral membrane protein n=1 Tax=Mangrovactinospora gilvigrisea TaxID=1428644 RepID=A0A1J7BA78_9ACTN|nr:hypothetical protein [Mangrovactinospora gilvigrisea]OIV35563.1 hypothetical protein BIV57_20785 [Mangrovactinospora gilvigrisea]
MLSSAIRLARVNSGSELAAVVFLVLGYTCTMVGALLPNVWLFAVAAAVSYLADWRLHEGNVYLIRLLSRFRAGISMRFFARELMLVLLMARLGRGTDGLFYAAIAGFLVFYVLQAAHGAGLTVLRRRRQLPVVTRNIDLSGMRIPDAPPTWLTSRGAEKVLHLDLPAMAGLLVYAGTRTIWPGIAGLAVTLAAAVLTVLVVAGYLRPSKLPVGREKALEVIDTWLRTYRPDTAVYFSGSRDSAYQVNMWLDTLKRTGGRPVLILRERAMVPQLAPTSVPVLCVPSAVHLMNLDTTSLRTVLYPANVGKNVHMIREPIPKHVFVGHGDSDKAASVNPFSKAYDEVWTAGRAGRDRYALAEVGVRDEDIVEVGRPQLRGITTAAEHETGEMPTVLYAPTWENWTDGPGGASPVVAGENIVRALLEAEKPVRVLYKKHPLIGTRSPAAKQVHERIVAMLEEASAKRAAERDAADPKAAEERRAARAELSSIDAELNQLLDAASGGNLEALDEAVASRDGFLPPEVEARVEELQERWKAAFWRSLAPWEHASVEGARPHLFDCFNQSDAMVSDISSVVSDFVASGKPIAVMDTARIGADEFRRQNTAARAAYILTPRVPEMPELLAAVQGGADPMAEARHELKEYLLGPDHPDAQTRFNAANAALAAKSEARLKRQQAAEDRGDRPMTPADGAGDGEGDDQLADIETAAADDAP